MVNKYDDYILDIITESIKNNETRLFLSNRLIDILENMAIIKHNNIAKYILDTNNNVDFKTKISYIDIDSSGLDMVSFITVPKAVELILKDVNSSDINDYVFNYYNTHNSDLYTKNRTKIKIGKLLVKLYGDKFKVSGDPDKDIESFVNIFKSLRDVGIFELVNSDDIKKYYHQSTYIDGEGKLNNSCMRHSSTQEFIEFYSKNTESVSLLILKDKIDNKKIRGRALVWKLEIPSGRTFMDRIYTAFDSDVELFKDYAIKNGWLYKERQTINEYEKIVDPVNNTINNITLVVGNMSKTNKFPYTDTLKCYNPYTLKVTNNSDFYNGDGYYFLENTDGGYDGRNGEDDSEELHEGQIYVDYYDDWFDEEDLNWCEFGDEYRLYNDCFYSDYYNCYISDDYAENNMIYCLYNINGDGYRESSDTVELSRYGEYATQEYLNSDDCKLTYIENSDEWLKNSDTVWSDHYNEYLDKNNSIEVYTDSEQNDTDWRLIDDGTYIIHDDTEYDIDVNFDEDED